MSLQTIVGCTVFVGTWRAFVEVTLIELCSLAQLSPSAASRQTALLGFGGCDGLWPYHGPVTFPQPFLDCRQPVAAAEASPFLDENGQFPAHAHQPNGGFGTVPVVADLVADGHLQIQHLQT